VLYALGPGDAVESYQHWKAGKDLLSETSRTFSGQFFDFCRRNGHTGFAISSFSGAGKVADGSMVVENRPKRFVGGGIRYHISQALYGISIMLTAVRWRADAVIVDSGTTHWALLGALKMVKIRVVGSLHNVPWPSGYKPRGRLRRILLATEGWFWRHIASAVISVSPECERQVRELAGTLTALAVQHRVQFDRNHFAFIPASQTLSQRPFRVMFAGRIERNKGVFDIVEIARLLESSEPGKVMFDICGSGTALEELNDFIQRARLGRTIRTHGKLVRPDLLQKYAACHAVIVPTRSEFHEGMAMVAVEAILCGRPVVASPLVPAVELLSGAVANAKPDDPASYADAIRRLVQDAAYYDQLCAACILYQEQFYDPRKGLAAALETVFGQPASAIG